MLHKLMIAAIAAACMTSVSVVHAADITRTYDITASDFYDVFGDEAPPIVAFEASFTITFDPTVDTVGSTDGLVVNSLSFPASSAYSYYPPSNLLSIATNPLDEGTINYPDGEDSYGIYVNNATAVGFEPASTVYVSIGEDGALFANQVGTTLVSAAPEPSTWALMIAGVGMSGAAFRFGRKQGSAAIA